MYRCSRSLLGSLSTCHEKRPGSWLGGFQIHRRTPGGCLWAADGLWGEQAAGLDRPGSPLALPGFSSNAQENMQQTRSSEDARQSRGPDPFPRLPPGTRLSPWRRGAEEQGPLESRPLCSCPLSTRETGYPPPTPLLQRARQEGACAGAEARGLRPPGLGGGKGASCGGREITGRGRSGEERPSCPAGRGRLVTCHPKQQGFSAPVASRAAEPDCLGKAGNIAGLLEGDGGCVFHPSRDGSGLAASSCLGRSHPIVSLRLASGSPGSSLCAAWFSSPV